VPFKPIDPQIKADLIHDVRNNGLSVMEAADKYKVSSKTIYGWLRNGVVDSNRNLILENTDLKKNWRLLIVSWVELRLRCSAQKDSHPGRGRARMATALPGHIWPRQE